MSASPTSRRWQMAAEEKDSSSGNSLSYHSVYFCFLAHWKCTSCSWFFNHEVYCFLCLGALGPAHSVWPFLLHETGRRQRKMAAESNWTSESLDHLFFIYLFFKSWYLQFLSLVQSFCSFVLLNANHWFWLWLWFFQMWPWWRWWWWCFLPFFGVTLLLISAHDCNNLFAAFFFWWSESIISHLVRIGDTKLCGTGEWM